jgi:hypothetical protein
MTGRLDSAGSARHRMRWLCAVVVLFVGSACGSDDALPDAMPDAMADAALDAAPDAAGPARMRVFVTSEAWQGDMGEIDEVGHLEGLQGADARCQAFAAAAGLGGTWKAWLSTTGQNAITRMADVGPWYLVDRTTTVFASKAAMTSPPLHAIDKDEKGVTANYVVWTGTADNGTATTRTCSGWTTTATGSGDLGLSSSTALWTFNDPTDQNASTPCASTAGLYCFEQGA